MSHSRGSPSRPRTARASSTFSSGRQVADEAGVLAHQADVAAPERRQLGRVEPGDHLACDGDQSRVGPNEPGEHAKERALAGARPAGDDRHPPGRELRRAAVEHRPLAPAAPDSGRRPRAARPPRPRRRPPRPAPVRPQRSPRRARRPARAGRRRRAAPHGPGGRCRRHAGAPRGAAASRRGPTTMAASPAPAASSLSRPSRMWTARSAMPAAAGSWLTRTTVADCSRASSPISAYAVCTPAASSSPAGSSARSRAGRWATAAQMAMR